MKRHATLDTRYSSGQIQLKLFLSTLQTVWPSSVGRLGLMRECPGVSYDGGGAGGGGEADCLVLAETKLITNPPPY